MVDDFVRPFVARWRLLALALVGGALLALGAAAVWPRSYTATVSFTPEQSTGGSIGGSLAGALGSLSDGLGSVAGNLPGGLAAAAGGGNGLTPDFFAGVLKSRELLDSTVASTYRDPAGGAPRTLVAILKPRGATPARRAGNARRRLEKKAVVTIDRRSTIVTLAVTLGDPQLAADVANRMAELLNVYNLERRQSSSREQRRFVETRLARAEQELRQAEQALTLFLAENRRYQGSPTLEQRAMRLATDARVRQDLVLGLRKSYEDARIAEVRDTPVLSIVDHGAPPDRPTNPRPLLWTVLGAVLGLMLAGAYVLLDAARTRRGVGLPAPAAAYPDGVRSPTAALRREPVEAIEPGVWAERRGPAPRSSER